MGSSSKNKGSQQPVAPKKPARPAQPLHGDPLTWDANGNVKTWKPPPPPPPPPEDPRQQLAQLLQPTRTSASTNGIYYPGNRGSAWMEGGRGGEHASGGQGFGLGGAIGGIGRSMGIGDGKGRW